jgi:signal peptidase I
MGNPARFGSAWTAAVGLILLSSCGDGGGGTEPDPQLQPETLASFHLTVPDSITQGEAFSLTVNAVGSRASNPLTTYSGSVTLSTTVGTITPTSLSVTNGTGTAQVTLGDPGQQTLNASGGGRTGTVTVQVAEAPALTGAGNDPVESAIPDLEYVPDVGDFSNTHPEMPGIYISFNTALLAFQLGTTVGEANQLLAAADAKVVGGFPGVEGVLPGILFIELPTSDHAAFGQALSTLEGDSKVLRVVPDALLSTNATTNGSGGGHSDWAWDSPPAGGNWGLEVSRVPQMWNLLDAVKKAGGFNWTGVIEWGADDAHEDLLFNKVGVVDSDAHGTHVAGIIGAKFDNERGIDGVNPRTRLLVKTPVFGTVPGSELEALASYGESLRSAVISLSLAYPEVRVINLSLGFLWAMAGINPNNNEAAREMVDDQGWFTDAALSLLSLARSLPLIVTAAGNDGGVLAKYNNPFCNAALAHGARTILCVENVRFSPGSSGEVTLNSSSNIGGHISAPGTDILSTLPGHAYGLFSGTSMASPFVAGVGGFILSAAPNLSSEAVRNLLIFNGAPASGGAADRVDAWASLLDVDRVWGGNAILRMMLDIDDGTPDGNQRVDYSDSPDFGDYDPFDNMDPDGDGGIGDGKIDMSDFRRWRDWFLQIEDESGLNLDGSLVHSKFDINNNGEVEEPEKEGIYPRGDFNGDGVLSDEAKAFVPGALGGEFTDIEVLKVLFDDPDYDKDDLDTLVLSVDLEVDATTLFEGWPLDVVSVEIRRPGNPPAGGALIQSRMITPDAPRQVLTIRRYPDGFRPLIKAGSFSFDIDEEVIGRELGGDMVFRPIYSAEVEPTTTFISTCEDPGAGDAVPILLSDWGIEPGDILLINGEGRYFRGDIFDDKLMAVFSTSGQITKEFVDLPGDTVGAPPKKLVRRTVTGAIDAGSDVTTPRPYYCYDQVTDIPEDFSITPHVLFEVPSGATHLFVAARDSRYEDNRQDSGDPLKVDIMAIYAPEWERWINRVSRGGQAPDSGELLGGAQRH